MLLALDPCTVHARHGKRRLRSKCEPSSRSLKPSRGQLKRPQSHDHTCGGESAPASAPRPSRSGWCSCRGRVGGRSACAPGWQPRTTHLLAFRCLCRPERPKLPGTCRLLPVRGVQDEDALGPVCTAVQRARLLSEACPTYCVRYNVEAVPAHQAASAVADRAPRGKIVLMQATGLLCLQ